MGERRITCCAMARVKIGDSYLLLSTPSYWDEEAPGSLIPIGGIIRTTPQGKKYIIENFKATFKGENTKNYRDLRVWIREDHFRAFKKWLGSRNGIEPNTMEREWREKLSSDEVSLRPQEVRSARFTMIKQLERSLANPIPRAGSEKIYTFFDFYEATLSATLRNSLHAAAGDPNNRLQLVTVAEIRAGKNHLGNRIPEFVQLML